MAFTPNANIKGDLLYHGHVRHEEKVTVAKPTVVDDTGDTLVTKDYLESFVIGAQDPYIHPATHPATMIVEDAENRFVSDAEKASWNARANYHHHAQGIPSATWVIQHNLGRPGVSVTIMDSMGSVMHGAIKIDSDNQVTLSFAHAFSGSAYIV